jgi:hypothetical protein
MQNTLRASRRRSLGTHLVDGSISTRREDEAISLPSPHSTACGRMRVSFTPSRSIARRRDKIPGAPHCRARTAFGRIRSRVGQSLRRQLLAAMLLARQRSADSSFRFAFSCRIKVTGRAAVDSQRFFSVDTFFAWEGLQIGRNGDHMPHGTRFSL